MCHKMCEKILNGECVMAIHAEEKMEGGNL
jgi:hypothetical protein